MPNEIEVLREQCRAGMAAAPMCDYADDPAIRVRVGKFFADQAAERTRLRLIAALK
jgi:hypothetical protein